MLCGRECGPSGRSLARAGWTEHVASGTGGGLDGFLVRGSREVPSIRFARRVLVISYCLPGRFRERRNLRTCPPPCRIRREKQLPVGLPATLHRVVPLDANQSRDARMGRDPKSSTRDKEERPPQANRPLLWILPNNWKEGICKGQEADQAGPVRHTGRPMRRMQD